MDEAGDGRPTAFLNVDLDVEATEPLEPLVAALASAAPALHHEAVEGGYRATFELARDPEDAEAGVAGLASAVRALPAEVRALWSCAHERVFSIGIEAGTASASFAALLRPSTLALVAELGASLEIVVYPASTPRG